VSTAYARKDHVTCWNSSMHLHIPHTFATYAVNFSYDFKDTFNGVLRQKVFRVTN